MRIFATAIAMVCFALAPALAAEPEMFSALPGKPRLANLRIEIWPEFDRPSALVFLKGEIAPGTSLGRVISLRLPASSDGPSAVAHSSAADGNLFTLPYERTDAKDFITLRIQPPDRFFHVEFYDKLDTGADKREYRYLWPGDFAVDHLSVQIQQPSGASGFSISPAFSDSAPGNDSLIYWTKDMGAIEAGKTLPIAIRYTKSGARTSKELLGLNTAAPANAPVASAPVSGPPPASGSDVPGSVDPSSYWLPAALFALLGAAVAVFLVVRSRKTSGAGQGGAGFCTKCGNALRGRDRFCSRCGTPASKSAG